MAQSLYLALRARHPAVSIDVVAPAWSKPLLTRMPEINRVIGLDIVHGELGMRKRIALGRQLRKENYTHAFVLPRSFKSALLPWLAKVPHRAGDLGEFRYGLLNKVFSTNKDKKIPNVCNYLRYLDLDVDVRAVKEKYRPQLQVDKDKQKKLLEKYQLTRDVPLIAIMPGAEYGPSKQWPPAHFASLLDLCYERGWQGCIFGSPKDRQVADEIQRLCKHDVHNICGETSIPDVVDLLAACRVAVTNDSGLMHIAAAVDVPTVTMYGATTPSYTPPLHPKAKTFYLQLACSPCWQRTCQYDHYRCLSDILPKDVLLSVNKFIDYKK